MGQNFHPTVYTISFVARLKLNSKIDFFNDHEFFEFKRSLDSEMKRLQRKGLGSRKRQAQVLTIENEEKLWKSGLLGDSNPKQLLDTMVFAMDYILL